MSIDTAIVLSAGRGSRMGHPYLPKALCPFGGKPMLEYVLSGFNRAGLARVVVVIGHRGDLIRRHFGSRYETLHIDYAVQTHQRGTADALVTAAPLIGGETAVLVTFCDIIIAPGWYTELAKIWERRPKLAALVSVVEDNPSNGSIVEFNERRLLMTDIRSRPSGTSFGWRDAAVSIYSKDSLSIMSTVEVGGRGELQATEGIRLLLGSGKAIGVAKYSGPWADLGSADAIHAAASILPQLTDINPQSKT